MYSEALLEHFRNPRRVGSLDSPSVSIEVENPICGDILLVSATIRNGVVRDARFRVRGCTASIAAGSALSEMLIGKSSEGLRRISPADVEMALDGLPNESKHAARLAVDAARALAARMR